MDNQIIEINNQIVPDIEQYLITSIGEDVWEKFQVQTRVEIITSEISLRAFRTFNNTIDFSLAITPLMKALELELRKNYYGKYRKYIFSKYTPEEYCEAVDANCSGSAKTDRNLIITTINYVPHFSGDINNPEKDGEVNFTIGGFRHMIGLTELTSKYIDEPFLKFCKSEIFSQQKASTNKIVRWVRTTTAEIEKQRELRSESVHGGKTQSFKQASDAYDLIINARGLLIRIVDPKL